MSVDNPWQTVGKRVSLGELQADQQRRHRIDTFTSRLIEGACDDLDDAGHMFAGCDLENHAAKPPRQLDLAADDVRANSGPSSTIAAAVSSQLVSIPRIRMF